MRTCANAVDARTCANAARCAKQNTGAGWINLRYTLPIQPKKACMSCILVLARLLQSHLLLSAQQCQDRQSNCESASHPTDSRKNPDDDNGNRHRVGPHVDTAAAAADANAAAVLQVILCQRSRPQLKQRLNHAPAKTTTVLSDLIRYMHDGIYSIRGKR